jgi:hypothetical protein
VAYFAAASATEKSFMTPAAGQDGQDGEGGSPVLSVKSLDFNVFSH